MSAKLKPKKLNMAFQLILFLFAENFNKDESSIGAIFLKMKKNEKSKYLKIEN